MMKQSWLLCVLLLVVRFAWADEVLDLAKEKSCMACHNVRQKVVGPAFVDIAKKYVDQAGVEEKLVQKIKSGGSGVWGVVPMPANSQISNIEAHQLVKWI